MASEAVTNRVLIVAEHSAGRLNESTARCVSCAGELEAAHISVVVFSQKGSPVPGEAARVRQQAGSR